MLRFLTAGESHGPAEVAILEGLPAGLSLTTKDIMRDLRRRQGGYGRGGRGKIETDEVKILSGVRLGKTLGSPIALLIENKDFTNWRKVMMVEPADTLSKPITAPRPGHTDLAGALKYQTEDLRDIIERASARETVMRVAIGAICRQFLLHFGIEIASHTIQIGSWKLEVGSLKNWNEYFTRIKNIDQTDPDIRCIDQIISAKMKEAIRRAAIKKDTLGGLIEVIGHNLPPGLGSHVHWDRKIDGKIAQALMSIPSVKAVEIGDGVVSSSKFGSEVQDEIFYGVRPGSANWKSNIVKKGFIPNSGFYRLTNRLGGIEGGITNGEDIVLRVYHKPLSTLGKPLRTVDLKTKKSTKALIERSDICVVPRAGVISEAMLAFVIADCLLEKFGGDTIKETRRNYETTLSATERLKT